MICKSMKAPIPDRPGCRSEGAVPYSACEMKAGSIAEVSSQKRDVAVFSM